MWDTLGQEGCDVPRQRPAHLRARQGCLTPPTGPGALCPSVCRPLVSSFSNCPRVCPDFLFLLPPTL